MKRGQLTLFFILGILIVISVSVLLYLQKGATFTTAPPSETIPRIQACLDALSREGVSQSGLRGGRFDAPGIWNGVYSVAYAVNQSTNGVPTRSEVAHDLEDALVATAPTCFTADYAAPGAGIKLSDISVTVVLNDDSALVTFTPVATITESGATRTFDGYTTTVKSDLGFLRKEADGFIDRMLASEGALDTDSLADDGVDVKMTRVGMDAVLLELNRQGGMPFVLAIPAPGDAMLPPISRPIITPPAPVELAAGEHKAGIIQAADPKGTELTYEAVSPIVTIDSTGAYLVQTTATDVGTHNVPIIVTTADGVSSTAILRVVVV